MVWHTAAVVPLPVAVVRQTCAGIPRASASTYRLTAADLGRNVRVSVSATNQAGSGHATSQQVGPVTPDTAELNAMLLRPLHPTGGAATIPVILERDGYTASLVAITTGSVEIRWYSKHTLLATGATRLTTLGFTAIEIKLTKAGRKLLRATNQLTCTGEAILRPSHGPRLIVSKVFSLRR
jgi:hypothetical protein